MRPVYTDDSMSTPLTMALRESCDYLRDADFHQTAQLMTVAADEIERLTRELQISAATHRPIGTVRQFLSRGVRSRIPHANGVDT